MRREKFQASPIPHHDDVLIFQMSSDNFSTGPLFHDRPIWAWLPICVVLFLALIHGGFTPADDLVRHITSYRHDFNYSHYYLYADVLSTVTMSPWFGFEWMAGHLHSLISRGLSWQYPDLDGRALHIQALKLAMNLIVLLALGLFGLVFVPVFRQVFQHRPMPHIMTGIALTVILFEGVVGRLLIARPEVFMMLAMFSAWLLPPKRWVILMMLLQPLYWLSFLYVAGLLLIPSLRWPQKLLACALILFAYALFWHFYCGLEAVAYYFQITNEALKTRLIHASENLALLDAGTSLKGIWIAMFGMALYRWGDGDLSPRERWSMVAFMLLWIMANQIRYLIYCGPCLVYMWARQCFSGSENSSGNFSHAHQGNFGTGNNYLFGALAMVLVSCLPMLPIQGFQAPLFKTLPPEAKILTFFDASTFILPALYPDVRVSPPMEAGFSNLSLQRFMKEHKKDKQGKEVDAFNCAAFLKNFTEFTYVVDSSDDRRVPASKPECLELAETHGVWRLWRVVAVAPKSQSN